MRHGASNEQRSTTSTAVRAGAMAALAMVTMVTTTAGCDGGELAQGSFDKPALGAQPLLIRVLGSSGTAKVSAGSDDKVHVGGQVRVRAPSRDEAASVLDQIERDPPIVVDKDAISVGALDRYQLSPGLSVVIDYDITAPPATAATVVTASGSVEVDGLGGAISVETASGEATVSDAGGAVSVRTASGRIEIAGAAGDVSTHSASGTVQLGAVGGNTMVETASGSVALSDLHGNLGVQTASGSIEIDSALGPSARYTLGSASGTVTLHATADDSFALDASSSSGRIEVGSDGAEQQHADYSLQTTVGDAPGERLVTVRTTSGAISVSLR